MTIARTAWRAGLPDVVVHTTEKTRNAHPSYAGAKSGDREAATRLAYDLLSNAALESIRRQLGGRRPLLVPVRAIERTGINLIPDAMSHEMALRMGLDVTLAIVQTNTVGHTRAGVSTASPSSRRLTGRSRLDATTSSWTIMSASVAPSRTFGATSRATAAPSSWRPR
jgi:hypothetical protein